MPGTGCRFEYHVHKDESAYLLSGRLKLVTGASKDALVEVEVEPGAIWHNVAGAIHTVEAITNCVVVEVSTPELDDVRAHLRPLRPRGHRRRVAPTFPDFSLRRAGSPPASGPPEVNSRSGVRCPKKACRAGASSRSPVSGSCETATAAGRRAVWTCSCSTPLGGRAAGAAGGGRRPTWCPARVTRR